MKIYYLSIILLALLPGALDAQEKDGKVTNFKLGISFSSFGNNDVIRNEELIGAASYNGDDFYSLGVNIIYPLNKWLEFESGLDYTRHTIVIKPAPGVNMPSRTENFSLINIPLTARMNFLRFFFVNGGALLDFDATSSMPVDSQTGIGFLLGVGLKYDFNFGASVFVNPYTKWYSVIPFINEEYHQRVTEDGFRMGITMSF